MTKIKYKGTNLDMRTAEVKKSPMGIVGANRFEETEKLSMAIPNQVIEEWIDETLKQDEDEKAADAKEMSSD